MGINAVAEIAYYDTVLSEINRTLATASEQAVNQVLASDELFTADMGVTQRYKNTAYTTILTADGTNKQYTDKNLFEVVYKTNNKDELYLRMFQNNALFNDLGYMQEVCKIKTTLGSGTGQFSIPLIARMGLLSVAPKMLDGESYNYLKQVVDASGYPLKMVEFGNRDWMHLYDVKKYYNTANSNQKEHYYLAPTNVGITYLDPNLLQTAFASNMDILMRGKYAEAGDVSEGVGIPNVIFGGGEDYVLAEDVQTYAIDNNIINNGKFAYVKGRCSMSTGVGYTGGTSMGAVSKGYITPTVSYKVVDVCNPENEQLVRMALTEIQGESNFENYKQWLVTQGIDINQPHYCVIAKVTFYADIIIPYSTPLSRNLHSLYTRYTDVSANDFFQVSIDSATLLKNGLPDFYSVDDKDMISAVTGNPYFTYTTYVAIMP